MFAYGLAKQGPKKRVLAKITQRYLPSVFLLLSGCNGETNFTVVEKIEVENLETGTEDYGEFGSADSAVMNSEIMAREGETHHAEILGSETNEDSEPENTFPPEVVMKPPTDNDVYDDTDSKPINEIPRSIPGPVFIPTPKDSTPICSISNATEISLSIPKHQDVAAGKVDRYGFKSTVPATDVEATQVVKVDIGNVRGNVFPIGTFSLDDVAFIMRDDENIDSVLEYTSHGERLIKIPYHAIMIYDANNPNFSAGAVDSHETTIYQFTDKIVNLPGRRSMSLKQVYELGVPLLGHNQISMSELKKRGLVDAQGNLSFKVFHVAHGYGYLSFTLQLPRCK